MPLPRPPADFPDEAPPGIDDPRSDPSCGEGLECSLEEAADMGACFDTWEEEQRFDRRLAEVRAAGAAA